MSSNIFYKALAAVSTVGIVVIAGIQVTTALKKSNTAEDQLAKTMIEIKNARKDALAEVKAIRSDLVKELNNIRSNTLNEIKADRANALAEVKSAKKDALDSVAKKSGTDSSKVWMVVRYTGNGGATMFAIPTKSFDDCEIAGATMEASKRFTSTDRNIGFECLEGQ